MPFITQCHCGSDMISLASIEVSYIKHLVDILNNDRKLNEQLSSNNDPISLEQFIAYNAEWSRRTNSRMFAIVLDDEAIGMISLSYIDNTRKTARIGYWLASAFWGKGYVSSAFEQILALARGMNIMEVSSTIDSNNDASKAIWAKHGSMFSENGGKLQAVLPINR